MSEHDPARARKLLASLKRMESDLELAGARDEAQALLLARHLARLKKRLRAGRSAGYEDNRLARA